jgi:hypothetical protein
VVVVSAVTRVLSYIPPVASVVVVMMLLSVFMANLSLSLCVVIIHVWGVSVADPPPPPPPPPPPSLLAGGDAAPSSPSSSGLNTTELVH